VEEDGIYVFAKFEFRKFGRIEGFEIAIWFLHHQGAGMAAGAANIKIAQAIVIDIADGHLRAPRAFHMRQEHLDGEIIEIVLDMFPIAFYVRGYILQLRRPWREMLGVVEM